jgi:hypothetical protein
LVRAVVPVVRRPGRKFLIKVIFIRVGVGVAVVIVAVRVAVII